MNRRTFFKSLALVGAVFAVFNPTKRKRKLSVPLRGWCAVCGEPVFHHHPWWTANPERHDWAAPMHDECVSDYFSATA